MCDDQIDAAPRTHATLVATLVLESGSIVLATPTPTTTMATTAAANSTMSSVSMSTTLTPAPITATPTSIPTSIPSTTAGATTSSNPGLSQAQIGGIAAGCAAIAVLAALLALVILLRRRRGFARVRDSWSPKGSQGSPGSLPISQPQYKEPKMLSFTRALRRNSRNRSVRPGTTGLAISPGGFGAMYGTPGARVISTEESMQDAKTRSDPNQGRTLVVRNIPPQFGQAPPPAVPPMSPRRAVSSFNFFPEGQPRPQEGVAAQVPNSQAKPSLTVAIPPLRPKRQSASSANRAHFDGGRDSVVTEFAEDGEDSATGLGSAQIWRPPATDPASATTYYVADKWGNWVLGGSESTLAVQEPIAEMATPISKTAEEREEELRQQGENRSPVEDSNAVRAARRKMSSPTIPEAVALRNIPRTRGPTAKTRGDQLKSTIRLVTPDSGRLPVNSRSSSVYSSNWSGQTPLQYSVAPTAENPLPKTTSTAGGSRGDERGQDAQQRRQSKGEAAGGLPGCQLSRDSAATMMSMDSATTIADSPIEATFEDFPLPARTSSLALQRQSSTHPQGSLSPVVESPGRSPVTYPHIPRPQSSNNWKSLGGKKRPLPNPVLRSLGGAPLSESSDSPTLGAMPNSRPSQGQTSYYSSHPHAPMPARKTSPTNPYPDRNPGEIRTGSPNMQDARDEIVVQKRRGATDRARLPSQQTQSRYGPLSIYGAYNDPSPPGSSQPSLPSTHAPQQQQYQAYQPPPQPRQDGFPARQEPPTFLPSPPSAPDEHAMYSSRVGSPARQPGHASERPREISPNYLAHNGSSSSLLAKRLGAERAAEFGTIESPGAASAQKGWTRRRDSLRGDGERVLTPKGAVVRGAGAQGPPGGESAGNAKGHRHGNGTRDTYVQLPATPGWKPQLTPKKRGEDLYLSVK